MALDGILSSINNLTAKIDGINFPQISTGAAKVSQSAQGAPLSLGDFHFVGKAMGAWAPSSIDFGMSHNFTVHTLVGGARVIDANGAVPEDITFDGHILGPDASDLARELRHMAEVAEVRTLIWGEQSFDVLVRRVRTPQAGPFQFTYNVECLVMGVTPQVAAPSVDAAALSDVQAAAGALPATETGIAGALSSAMGVLKTAGNIASTAGQFASTLVTAEQAVKSRVLSIQSSIRAIGSLGTQNSTSGLIGALQSAQTSFGALGSLSASGGYIGRTIGAIQSAGL